MPLASRRVDAVYLVETEDGSQLAGLTSQLEAERALAFLEAERRHGDLHLNAVPLHRRLEDWMQDR